MRKGKHNETNRQADRQTDRQTNRQTDRNRKDISYIRFSVITSIVNKFVVSV